MKSLSAAIISWEGKFGSARKIAGEIAPWVDNLKVVYSNASSDNERGEGVWKQVPNENYFGAKFQEAISEFSDDIFLLIHADAEADDWGMVARRCRSSFDDDSIAIWTPEINYTFWDSEKVRIGKNTGNDYSYVAQTDAIVVAYSKSIVRRLQTLDYSINNLGWGIDWIAICNAYCSGRLAVIDHEIKIFHPKSTGYGAGDANKQMQVFLGQMTVQESLMYRLLSSYIASNAKTYEAGTPQ